MRLELQTPDYADHFYRSKETPLGVVTVEMPEADSAEAPPAYHFESPDRGSGILRRHRGRLFAACPDQGFEHERVRLGEAAATPASLAAWLAGKGRGVTGGHDAQPMFVPRTARGHKPGRTDGADPGFRRAMARKVAAEDYLVVSGEIWRRVGEPVVAVKTDYRANEHGWFNASLRYEVPVAGSDSVIQVVRCDSARTADLLRIIAEYGNSDPLPGAVAGHVRVLDGGAFRRDDLHEIARTIGRFHVRAVERLLEGAPAEAVAAFGGLRDTRDRFAAGTAAASDVLNAIDNLSQAFGDVAGFDPEFRTQARRWSRFAAFHVKRCREVDGFVSEREMAAAETAARKHSGP